MDNLLKQSQDRLKFFKRHGYDIPKARRFILRKAGFANGSILEVGTGSGHMAIALARRGFSLVSIDVDRKAQKTAKSRLKALGIDKLVTLKIMNAERLKFKDMAFDNVISVNFLHHAKAPVKCLKEMARVVKNKLVITDFNRKGERIAEKIHGMEGHTHPRSKLSLGAIVALLKRSGMAVIKHNDSCQYVLIATKGEVK
ncbi:MAG: class I SAM-dependent methyltransferase [Candidatus Omnitrophica bacterium]|nr:class I SAM-dependent methyltransferase [Candidatus Omnitrophota bacterium]MDD5547014.1 class I SAM-dependent methyltransferase [Candidatus Omnitrophota bacterium]